MTKIPSPRWWTPRWSPWGASPCSTTRKSWPSSAAWRRSRGLIILTDSDGAGFVLRNYLKGALPKDRVKQAYIPDVKGKERRKRKGGKEGKLGVEGMSPAVLLEALRRAGATFEDEAPPERGEAITKADLFALGLSGGEGSAEKRRLLLKRLDLPAHLTANGMLEALNLLFSREELEALLAEA